MSLAIEPAAEHDLWREYRRGSDLRARDRLFLQYMPWAAGVGRSVYRRISNYSLDCDDFVQNAELGLLDAMSRFDPERGIDFRAFAKPRVRGAVFNGLRALLRDQGLSQDDLRYADRLSHLQQYEDDAFESVVDAIVGLGIGYMLEHHADGFAGDAYNYAKRDQVSARLSQAVGRLPERLRAIVTAHYFNHVPFYTLAEEMGLTKGRVSQLHSEALLRLRDALRDLR